MNEGWVRRRWWEFRQGHSIYLIFALTFINFILISYRLLIEKVAFLGELIPELWIFAIIFLVSYIPTAILIGAWHRKTQLSVENTIQQKEGPFFSKMMRVLLDAQTGKASDEEIKKFRKLLKGIEDKFEVGG